MEEQAKAIRYNQCKPPLSMLSVKALLDIAMVYEMGAQKYARDNWRKGMSWTSVMDSLLRHALAWLDGENDDHESGLPHMAHLAWNAMTLLEYINTHPELDDRYHTGPADKEDNRGICERFNLAA